MSPRSRWSPLLSGDEAEAAVATIATIARDLARRAPPAATANASLSRGAAGLSLFFYYLSAARSGTEAAEALDLAGRYIEAACEEPPTASGFLDGWVGLAWTLEHHRGRLLGEAELNDEVDDALAEQLVQDASWEGQFDLASGLCGQGIYALERMPRGRAPTLAARILDRLGAAATRDEHGLSWFTPPERMTPEYRAAFPAGCHNVGLAHGVAGVAALLSGLAQLPAQRAEAEAHVHDAVGWLRAHARADIGAHESRFGYAVTPDGASEGCRAAWCNGDPGVGAALLIAGECLDDRLLRDEAVALLCRTGRRPVGACQVVDAGLCHGAAGLAHLFNRAYQATGIEELAAHAHAWAQRALVLYRWEDGVGLLNGAAGVGLALLALTTPVAPAWDRALGLLLPPLGAVETRWS